MDCLASGHVELATGDPINCQKCFAILNKYSNIQAAIASTEEGAADQPPAWTCEFCNHSNKLEVHFDQEHEQPKTETVSYIIEAAPQKKKDTTPTATATTTAAATEEEKGADSEPSKPKDVSVVYCIDVSGSMQGIRLECVRKTILAQIEEMKEKYPERKVGIVTFSDSIKVIGDGIQ